MSRQHATSACGLSAMKGASESLKDARAASTSAITGKNGSTAATGASYATPPSTSSTNTAPTGAVPPPASTTRSQVRSPRTGIEARVAPPAESPRRPRRVYTDESTSLSLGDDEQTSSDSAQNAACQRCLGQPSATSTLRNGRRTNRTPSPTLASSNSPLVMRTPPTATTMQSGTTTRNNSDLIVARGGPCPPVAMTSGGKSPATAGTPSSSTAGVTSRTLSTGTEMSAPVNGQTSTAAAYNLLTPGAPQPGLQLPRASHAHPDETSPTTHTGSVDFGMPNVLAFNSNTNIPEISGTIYSALDSVAGSGVACRNGGSMYTQSILNGSTRGGAHLGTGTSTKGARGRSSFNVTLQEVDAVRTSSGLTRAPTGDTPGRSPTPRAVTSYRDLDVEREDKSKSPASQLTAHSKGTSHSVSPTRSAKTGEGSVVKLSALEEGTTKPMTQNSSRRSLLGSFRRHASDKDMKSVTSTQAPGSRSASVAGLKGGLAEAPGENAAPSNPAPSSTWVYQHKPCGLYNFGATCYMNAALQCVVHTPNFLAQLERQYRSFKGFTNREQESQGARPGKSASRANSFRFKKEKEKEKEKEKDNPIIATAEPSGSGEPRKFPATSALVDLGLEKPHKATRQLLQDVKSAAASYNNQFKGNGQNDAHELLRTILYVIHDEVNQGQGRAAPYQELKDEDEETEAAAMERWLTRLKSIDNSVVYDLFGGVLQSTCECLTCNRLSRTFDPFLDLSIPVHNAQLPQSPAQTHTAASAEGNRSTNSVDGVGLQKGLSAKTSDADALEASGASAGEWQSSGQGFAKLAAFPATAGVRGVPPSFVRERNGSITRDELGSLCLTAPANMTGSCSVDDIVSECFAHETQELMTGDNRLMCERCKAASDAVRRCKVSVWPKVLVLHLKRFTGDGHKDFTKVTYPQTFTLPQNKMRLRYRLCGVVCHSGSERFGHYTSYVSVHRVADDQLPSEGSGVTALTPPGSSPPKPGVTAASTGGSPGVVQRLRTQLETWYLCNDEHISKVDAKEALSALENAYILFYHQSP